MRVFLAFDLLGEHRHESHVEGALGKETTEHIGQAKRNQERLGHRACPQEGRDQDVAHKTQNAARHGPDADGEKPRQQTDGPGCHACALSVASSIAARIFFSSASCLDFVVIFRPNISLT